MLKNRGNILWIDDEINLLKPHILFLEEKGYSVEIASNGDDAVSLFESSRYDLLLVDQSMPGMDGLETLKKIKGLRQSIPVIMITKTEDEWLIDKAISSQVEQYLIKPVAPSQIFIACKQVLEKYEINSENTVSGYLKDFQEIDSSLKNINSTDGWWNLYNRLIGWEIKFDQYREKSLSGILSEQTESCNKNFNRFIESNYTNWLKKEDRPLMSVDIFPEFIKPKLIKNKKVCLIVIDCLRHDQLTKIMPILESFFEIDISYHLSLLPSATPYSRNGIFSGLFPDDLINNYPQQKADILSGEDSLNRHEELLFKDQMVRNGFKNKTVHYHKIWAIEEGRKFENKLQSLMNVDVIALVINFVDMLAHSSSKTNLLKEMVPDESGYRDAVKNWVEKSWFNNVLKTLSNSEYDVVLTSDHGSIKVQKSTVVRADKNASTGIRYKSGRNLKVDTKDAIIVNNPSEYRLPSLEPQQTYLISKNSNYFIYPNEGSKYKNKLDNSFQHGGISMQELLVPVVNMKGVKS